MVTVMPAIPKAASGVGVAGEAVIAAEAGAVVVAVTGAGAEAAMEAGTEAVTALVAAAVGAEVAAASILAAVVRAAATTTVVVVVTEVFHQVTAETMGIHAMVVEGRGVAVMTVTGRAVQAAAEARDVTITGAQATVRAAAEEVLGIVGTQGIATPIIRPRGIGVPPVTVVENAMEAPFAEVGMRPVGVTGRGGGVRVMPPWTEIVNCAQCSFGDWFRP